MEDDLPETSTPNQHGDDNANMPRNMRDETMFCQYPPSRHGKKKAKPRVLTPWEEFILTLVRTRKGFDVHFLADTFGVTAGHVSHVYNTWITFLSCELSFLVPWPSREQIRKTKRLRPTQVVP